MSEQPTPAELAGDLDTTGLAERLAALQSAPDAESLHAAGELLTDLENGLNSL
ncbi:hypothetical protein [Brevibacterium samyangense]|uniref:Uncharacterized protein n=1 Tax=Brevibacterium samyangense TaxID=366888 RepID=A0ABP5ETH5_9MICO